MKVIKSNLVDEVFMRRCIELAKNGLGRVEPNPLVGAVVVHQGKVVGEGYHQQYGHAHAEVNAINAVKDSSILSNSTLYINLEPCVHRGKTPPCVDLILEKKIPTVIIGTADPNSLVEGKGIERLTTHGVKVTTGILDRECYYLNKRFFTFHKMKRPYIILKWAQTSDGFIDLNRKPGESVGINWISSSISRALVHKWRTIEQAVMVGTNTVMVDNPRLNVRYWNGCQPVRIILDRSLKIPRNYKIWDNTQETIIFNAKESKRNGLTELIQIDFSDKSMNQVLDHLYKRNILSVMVEGGKKLHEYLINNDLWDEARVLTGDKFFNKGIKAPQLQRQSVLQSRISNDILNIFINT